MNKKAESLIISLWILAILVLLAVSLGHRVSLALRISRYQRDKLKALYLAKAGINRAIAEITDDTTPDYDSYLDRWADNEEAFKNISFDDDKKNEFSTVGYTVEGDGGEETVFGAIDEERKININTVPKEILTALLEKCQINSAQDVVNNILIWRGDIPDDNKIYENLGYWPKADKFNNIEELTLVEGITPENYQRLKGLITVYTDGSININTAPPEVLTVFTRGIAKSLSVGEDFADSVVAKIIDSRSSHGPFKTKRDIDITPTGDEETNIFNNFTNNIAVKSDNFLIEVTGNASRIKSRITAVYNRRDKRTLYWHES